VAPRASTPRIFFTVTLPGARCGTNVAARALYLGLARVIVRRTQAWRHR